MGSHEPQRAGRGSQPEWSRGVHGKGRDLFCTLVNSEIEARFFFFFFCLLSFVFCHFRAMAYGGSQSRGPIGAVATGL